jgi:hypothetical protein
MKNATPQGAITMLVPSDCKTQTIRICAVHQMVEVFPKLWAKDRFLTRSDAHSTAYARIEAACPLCLAAVQSQLRAQYPSLYT